MQMYSTAWLWPEPPLTACAPPASAGHEIARADRAAADSAHNLN